MSGRKCRVCASSAGLQCKQCQEAVYCSKICQRIDWDTGHHLACKPIGPNPDSSVVEPEKEKHLKKRQMTADPNLASLRLLLLKVIASLEDLKTNPPQTRSDDFMRLLQEIQAKMESAVNMSQIQGTLVPAESYIDGLDSAIDAARDLVSDMDKGEIDAKRVTSLLRDVNFVVRRVRAFLLNPEIWKQRNQPGSRLYMVPEDIVEIVAEKQRALEITRPDAAPWTLHRFLDGIEETSEEGIPVVCENSIYRIFEDNIRMVTGGTTRIVPHPASQLGAVNGAYFSGLHDTLWQWGEGIASNFRYDNGWHLVQSVDLPRIIVDGKQSMMIPFAVDNKNRLWVREHGHYVIGVVRTDKIGRNPTMVTWKVAPLWSPIITGIGLVAVSAGGLVNFTVDDNNNHATNYLRASSIAMKLTEIDESAMSDMRLVGDRASTQIGVLPDSEDPASTDPDRLLHIHDLHTNITHTHHYQLLDELRSGVPIDAVMGNDGRSIFVSYQGVQRLSGTLDANTHVFRLTT